MTSHRWGRIQELFDAALELPPAERTAFVLDRAEDTELRAEVLALLEAHESPGRLDSIAERLGASGGTAARLPSVVADRYAIERELGRGGMAVVYLAHDQKHDRRVALKVLQPELTLAVRPEQFVSEIQIAAKLTHPHVLPLYDSGEVEGIAYYVMPYVEGESLRGRLNREKKLPVADALRIAGDVAAALSYAHSRDVVHRDIKPGNILLTPGGEALIADFGIASALSVAGGATLSETGAVGTPLYMSPEQASGKDIDGRSDVYSLGCVVYEMLAGHPPFTGATTQEVVARHAHDPIPALEAESPDVPSNVARSVRRALAKDPVDRFATTDQFAAALMAPTAADRGSHSRPESGALLADPSAPGPPRRRLIRLAAAALAAFVVMAAGSTLWGDRTRETLPTANGPAGSPPEDSYLRELYQRGRQAELSRSLIGIQNAKEAYRRAIERDSSFALGYAGLAGAHGLEADYRYAPMQAALDTAHMMARRAVELDSLLPDTRTAFGVALANGHEFEAAEREFRRAIEVDPSSARAHLWYAHLLVALGRGEEGLREARLAQLDPFAPREAVAVERYATWLSTGERPWLGWPVRERRPVLGLESGEPWARALDALELAEAGECVEANAELERARPLVPSDNFRMLTYVGLIYWWCDRRADASALLAQIKRRPDALDEGLRVAWLHTRFGEPDSAFVWLEHQRLTLTDLAFLSANRHLDPLRSDPRYARLMVNLGIREPAPDDLRELYRRGQQAEASGSLVGIETARASYRRAIDRDPDFALGYAGLAGVYGSMADFAYAPARPALDSAAMMARRAVALDSLIPETRTALASTLADAGELEAAEQEFVRAIELGPSNARAHYLYSVLLAALGRGEEAMREAERAAELDPLASLRGVLAMQRYAEWLITGERPYLRLPVLERRRSVLDLEPGEPWSRARQAEDLAKEGQCVDARAEIADAERLAPDNIAMSRFVGAVYWWCGEERRARGVLEEMKRRPEAVDHGYAIAVLHTLFAETDSAFAWLDRHRWRLGNLSALSAGPYMDPLRWDPRFPELLRRLGLRE